MKNKIQLLIVILTFCSMNGYGQTVLLKVDQEKENIYNRGPNTEKFSLFFLKFGFALPPDQEQSRVVFENSVYMSFGFRKKYKLSKFYSMGWDLQSEFSDWKIKQVKSKTFPDTLTSWDVQRFDVGAFAISYFNRFNFDPKRGNTMGAFLDIGIIGKYNYSMVQIEKREVKIGDATTSTNNLAYTNKFQSDVFFRAGKGRVSLWAAYRITDLFKPSFGFKELPRTVAGIEVGLY